MISMRNVGVPAFNISCFAAKYNFSSLQFYPVLPNTSEIFSEHGFLSVYQAFQYAHNFIWSTFRVLKQRCSPCVCGLDIV